MEISFQGTTWTVLKVYEKKQREKDVFLCENKYGIKECFQRCDFECDRQFWERRKKKKLGEEEIKLIEEEVKKRTPRKDIFEMFKDYHQSKVDMIVKSTRRKLDYKYHEMYDGKCKGRAVLQYDSNWNLLNRFFNIGEASAATGIPQPTLYKYCKQKIVGKDFIWRYEEDDQFKREG